MENNQLILFTYQCSSRLQYIANVLLNQFLGLDFQIVTNKQYYISSPQAKINYTNQPLNTLEISIPNCGLLFENNITARELDFAQVDDLPVLFSLPLANTTLSFDYFSMAFYLLSRYEEYLPFTADMHGRFSATQSIATKYDFLHLPIIEIWLQQLRSILMDTFPQLYIAVPSFRLVPTYDIDLAWAYLHRPWWRVIGSSLNNFRKGEWKYLKQRQQVLGGKIADPYDVFADLQQMHGQLKLEPIFFFLLADYDTYDNNINYQQSALQQLIKKLHKQYQTGIHPSYQSNHKNGKLLLEIKRLENITLSTVRHSRQHFLKLHLPQTYQSLLQVGVYHDYSMGYADQIGFRAGTSKAYQWYDLGKEQATNLIIHPFCAMDVTLQQYLNLSPIAAVEKLRPIIVELGQVGGTFSTIWHNSSFSSLHGWEGWKLAYKEIISIAIRQIVK